MGGRWYWSAILDRFDLSDSAVHAYLCLCRFEKDGVCAPGLRAIAVAMHTSNGRVSESMKELEEAGAIGRERGGPAGWTRTVYTLLVWDETTVPLAQPPKEPRLSGIAWETTYEPESGTENGPKWYRDQPKVVPKTALSGTELVPESAQQREQRIQQREQLPAAASANSSRPSRSEENEKLDAVIESVRQRRSPPLSRDQAREARKIARDRLRAGWSLEQITKALVETSAFTSAAVDFASSPKRGVPSAAERSAEVLERRIRGER